MPNLAVAEGELAELYDVEVETLGLVTRGANREEFFLLKSASLNDGSSYASYHEGDVVEEGDHVELEVKKQDNGQVTEQLEQQDQPQTQAETTTTSEAPSGILKSLDNFLWRWLKRNNFEPITKAEGGDTTESPTDNSAGVTEQVEKESGEDISISGSPAIAEVTAEKSDESSAGSSTGENNMDENEKQEVQPTEVAKADTIALEKAMSTIQAMQEQITALEKAANDERDRRERMIYLQKADDLPHMGLERTELADHLQWLNRTDARRAEWFEKAFTAIDAQLQYAGLYSEVGTSNMPEATTLIEKAQAAAKKGDAKSLQDAILSMSKEEQMAYLAKAQGR